jgi:hypothetical protein
MRCFVAIWNCIVDKCGNELVSGGFIEILNYFLHWKPSKVSVATCRLIKISLIVLPSLASLI